MTSSSTSGLPVRRHPAVRLSSTTARPARAGRGRRTARLLPRVPPGRSSPHRDAARLVATRTATWPPKSRTAGPRGSSVAHTSHQETFSSPPADFGDEAEYAVRHYDTLVKQSKSAIERLNAALREETEKCEALIAHCEETKRLGAIEWYLATGCLHLEESFCSNRRCRLSRLRRALLGPDLITGNPARTPPHRLRRLPPPHTAGTNPAVRLRPPSPSPSTNRVTAT